METGSSTFQYTNCARRHSLSPKPACASASAIDDSVNALNGESPEAQARLLIPAKIARVLETLTSKLAIMRAEFKCLRAENRSLRSGVLQLWKTVLNRIPLKPSPTHSVANVIAQSSANPTRWLQAHLAQPRRPPSQERRASLSIALQKQQDLSVRRRIFRKKLLQDFQNYQRLQLG